MALPALTNIEQPIILVEKRDRYHDIQLNDIPQNDIQENEVK